MKEKDVKQIVKKAYGKIALQGGSCCDASQVGQNPMSCCGDSKGPQDVSESIGYSNEELSEVPEANLGLGCGNPTAFSKINEGDVVLDLGSGAGIDSFLAAKKVGEKGKVVGIDMTEDMVNKAKAIAKKHGYTNVDFRLGDIENLPVENDSVDVVISNCVINLAPNKLKVFKEAYRILKDDGRMYVSDIVLLKELNEEQKNDEDLLCGCVAGALLKQDYINKMKKAGFKVKIISEDKGISEKQYGGIALESIKIEATK